MPPYSIISTELLYPCTCLIFLPLYFFFIKTNPVDATLDEAIMRAPNKNTVPPQICAYTKLPFDLSRMAPAVGGPAKLANAEIV